MDDRKHPVSGRRIPSPADQIETLEPGEIEALSESEVPWLVFGPWTIYSMQKPTDASLAALLAALAELVKLGAAEAAHALAATAPRKVKEPDGFHELWGQAKESPSYDKEKWNDFQHALLASAAGNAKLDGALAGCLANRDIRILKLEAERDACKQEAQVQAQEARTQQAIVHDCYQAVTGGKGEPGDWNGAEPVRRRIAELERERDGNADSAKDMVNANKLADDVERVHQDEIATRDRRITQLETDRKENLRLLIAAREITENLDATIAELKNPASDPREGLIPIGRRLRAAVPEPKAPVDSAGSEKPAPGGGE